MDWKTPLGVTRIVTKEKHAELVSAGVGAARARGTGDPLPKVVPPGPDNPLGEHKMRLDIPGGAYLIHGTNRPAGVGMQVTHGCIRMYPEDIAELFALVPVNTKVNLVDQTTKVGWSRGTLFVERQAPLEGTSDPAHADPAEMTRLIEAATSGKRAAVKSTGRARSRPSRRRPGCRWRCRYRSARPRAARHVPAAAAALTPSNGRWTRRKRKRRGKPRRLHLARCEIESGDYLPIDFLNARSIFSFVASQQDCEPCAACRAWLAVLWAALAALEALEADAAAASAADLAAAASGAAALAAASAASMRASMLLVAAASGGRQR